MFTKMNEPVVKATLAKMDPENPVWCAVRSVIAEAREAHNDGALAREAGVECRTYDAGAAASLKGVEEVLDRMAAG